MKFNRRMINVTCIGISFLVIGLSASLILGQENAGRESNRTQPMRLPTPAAPSIPSQNSADPTVTFAGGSVNFTVPFGWQISEIGPALRNLQQRVEGELSTAADSHRLDSLETRLHEVVRQLAQLVELDQFFQCLNEA